MSDQPETQCLQGFKGGQGRDRTVDLPIFSRTLVPTELPGRWSGKPDLATLTGLEPATSALTGRRANQLRHEALHSHCVAVRLGNHTQQRAHRQIGLVVRILLLRASRCPALRPRRDG